MIRRHIVFYGWVQGVGFRYPSSGWDAGSTGTQRRGCRHGRTDWNTTWWRIERHPPDGRAEWECRECGCAPGDFLPAFLLDMCENLRYCSGWALMIQRCGT